MGRRLLLGMIVAVSLVAIAVVMTAPTDGAHGPARAARSEVPSRPSPSSPEPAPALGGTLREARRPLARPRPFFIPWRSEAPEPETLVDDGEDEDVDAEARDRFELAFESETRDEPWAESTEVAITLALGDVALADVSCRATLCKVELQGERTSLPAVPPFDGVGWWLEDRQGGATLLLVRDDAAIPLPPDPGA